MNNNVIKYASLGAAGAVGLIGIILVLTALSNSSDPEGMGGSLDGFFYVIYAAILVCTLLAIGFAVLQAAQAPKKAIGALVGIAVLVVILGISYAIADDSVKWVGKSAEEIRQINEQYSSGMRKFSGAAINATFIFLLLAVGSLFGMEVYRLIKK
jgi:hypothetical protein